MRVSRLEIFGFKSFVDRFVFNFDRNIIGVVGPNGCGKSNIVDALRWILGETHAKQLRGVVLEDLIFNGTQTRRPLGMAEVSITIRPNKDFTPQSLARLEPAEERIEGLEEGEQQVIADERSSILDIPGLFTASEIQLTRRLYRSGESEYFINRVPCRLRDMLDLYRAIGLGARGLSIVEQGQIGDIIGKKPIERRELLEEAAGISGFRARLEVAGRRLERTTENLARLNDICTEVERQVKVLRRQAKRAEERGELKERLKSLESAIFASREARILVEGQRHLETAEKAAAEGARVGAALDLLQAQSHEQRAVLEAADERLRDLRQARDLVAVRINQHVDRENRMRLDAAELQGKVQLAESRFGQNENRIGALAVEIERAASELEGLREVQGRVLGERDRLQALLDDVRHRAADEVVVVQRSSAEVEIEALTAAIVDLPTVSGDLVQAEQNLRESEGRLQEVKRRCGRAEVAVAAVRAEVSSLESQLEALVHHVTEEPSPTAEVLLGALTVPEELQRPVSALLGERSRFVVVDDVARQVESFERRCGAARQIGFVDRQFSAGRAAEPLTSAELERAPSARSLLESIGVRDSARPIIEHLLGLAAVVDTLQEGFRLVDLSRDRIAVTCQGAVVTSWGWYTTSGNGAELSFRRILEEKRAKLEEALRGLASVRDEVNAREGERNACEGTRAALHAKRELLLAKERELSNLLRAVEVEARRRREAVLQEERQVGEDLRRVSTEYASVEKTIALQERRRGDLRAEVEALEGSRTELRVEVDSAVHAAKAKEAELATGTGPSGVIEELRKEIGELEIAEQGLNRERSQVRHLVGEIEQELAERRAERDRFNRQENEARICYERTTVEVKLIREEWERLYQHPFPSEVEGEVRASETDEQLALQLRQRLEREGEVDSQSIALYEEERKRLEDLQAQCADLSAATGILERTIRQLREISRTRFVETFEFVSRKFAELVPRLFAGGSGVLELINPDDPLGSGVELSVRPPGKKLRRIELLSGGEKALAATAVLMAMFLHRPSPICVLDEVDAPLDDANLERFLSLVREMSDSSQFLMITHNKQSMAVADRLVGITMEERGVSKALTVSLDDAVRELEAVNA